jgi:hypothetical protein
LWAVSGFLVTKCIVVVFSRRPIIVNTKLNQSSAFVMAWISSTEGVGLRACN